MSNEPTFQDLLAGFADDIFVGRAEQLALFTQLFTAPRPPFLILAVSGQGGVGKTTLVEQFRHIATNHNALTLLVNEDQPTVLEVLASFTEQLRRAGYPLAAFEERYHKYRELKEQVEADPNAPKGLLDFIVRSATRIGMRSLKRIPLAGDAAAVLLAPDAEEHVVEETSALAAYVAQKFTNKDERVLVLEPEKELTGHFLQGLATIVVNRRVIFCFDTYEQTASLLDQWLRDFISGKFGRFSSRITFIIAGRYPLNQQWTGFSRATRQLELHPFTEAEARAYLTAVGITTEEEIQHLIELSERLPVLLTLLVSTPGAATGSVASTAVERFLQGLSGADQEAALVAALPRFFNRDLLALLLGEQQASTIFVWLAHAHFVRERADGWAYHDVVRSMLLRYYRLRSPTQATALHTTLATHYLAASQALPGTETAQRNDPVWRKLYLEYLYHTLSAQPEQGLHGCIAATLKDFASATVSLNGDEILEPRLKQLTDLITQVCKESEDDRLASWGKEFTVFAAFTSRSVQKADLIFAKSICDYPTLLPLERMIAYALLATLYSRFKDYVASIDAANQALAIESESTLALQIRGQAYFFTGDYASAIQDLQRVTQSQPDHADSYYWRGRVHSAMKEYPAALIDFTRAIELQPNSGYNYNWRGRTYREQKDYAAALADLTKAIELQPDEGNHYYWRGRTYRDQSNYAAALVDLTKAIELQPDDGNNYQSRGVTHYYVKDCPEALADLTKAVELRPENGPNYRWRGAIYRDLKDYPAALADLNKAIALQPENGLNYYWRGRTYRDLKDYPAALADLNKAITLQPEDSYNYYLRGIICRDLKDYPAALADLNKAIELQPEDGYNYSLRGVICRDLKDYPAALADLNKAIALRPENGPNYYWRGRTYRDLKDYPAALVDLNKAIELQPDNDSIYFWRGCTNYDLKDYPVALVDLNKAIELQPDNGSIYFWRGCTNYNLKDYPAALVDLNKAIELQSDNGSIYFWRGCTNYNLKDYPAALVDLNKAIELQLDNSNIYHWRGRTYRDQNNYTAALVDLTKAIELQPDDGYNYQSRGITHYYAKDYATALADLTKAIELQPENGSNYHWRGRTYRNQNNYAVALADLTKAIELQPENGSNYHWRGRTYLSVQDYDAAIIDFSIAVEYVTSVDRAYYWRSIAYAFSHDHAKAQADLAQAISVATDALVASPDDLDKAFDLALYELASGDLAASRQRYADVLERTRDSKVIQAAIDDLEDYLTFFPDNADAQAMRQPLQEHLAQEAGS